MRAHGQGGVDFVAEGIASDVAIGADSLDPNPRSRGGEAGVENEGEAEKVSSPRGSLDSHPIRGLVVAEVEHVGAASHVR